jgi:nucleotide-binding universal stress UspA family protein
MTTRTPTRKTKKVTDVHLGTWPLHLKRNLFATDPSSPASAAFKVAAQLGQHFGRQALHDNVISPMLYAAGGGVVAPTLQEVEIRRAREKLTQYFARLHEFGSIEREEIVTCGQAKELTREIVEEKNIDLVVMGSPSLRKIRWPKM